MTTPNTGTIITVPMSLRFFVKSEADAQAIQAILNAHFGQGEAVIGSGYAPEAAASLLLATLDDIHAGDPALTNQVKAAVTAVDLWRETTQDITAVFVD